MAKTKTRDSADVLGAFLDDDRVATLAQLKETLGTTGTMTVFRKLKALGYLTSYSHRGNGGGPLYAARNSSSSRMVQT